MSTNGSNGDGEARIAKALAHPLRAQILQRLGERVASPGDLAAELDAPLGVVSYHVRMLRDYDCVELVRTEPRRGALQHFYRAVARPELGNWRQLPTVLQNELLDRKLEQLLGDLGAAGAAGVLVDAKIDSLQLELDERGRNKLDRLLERTGGQVLAIQDESRERIASGGEPLATTVALMHFLRATGES
jgi:DNA-binding transcriptional ArsR family regulator